MIRKAFREVRLRDLREFGNYGDSVTASRDSRHLGIPIYLSPVKITRCGGGLDKIDIGIRTRPFACALESSRLLFLGLRSYTKAGVQEIDYRI